MRQPGAPQDNYQRLLEEYAGPLLRLAQAYARTSSDRDDLFQEIALALWSALPGFRGDSSERTWLYRVAHNTAIRFTSRRSHRARHEETSGDVPEAVSSGNPESTAIAGQQRQLLWQAVRELPISDRQLIILHLEGLGTADIQQVTGLSSANVATRLTRIRKKLLAAIREENAR